MKLDRTGFNTATDIIISNKGRTKKSKSRNLLELLITPYFLGIIKLCHLQTIKVKMKKVQQIAVSMVLESYCLMEKCQILFI